MNEVSHAHSSIPAEVDDSSEIFGMTGSHLPIASP